MNAVRELCQRGMLLKNGSVAVVGETSKVIDRYLDNPEVLCDKIEKNCKDLEENQFVSIYIADDADSPNNEFRHDDDINIHFEMFLPNWNNMLELSLSVYDKHKRRVFTHDIPLKDYYTGSPNLKIFVSIPAGLLAPGRFSWLFCINHPNVELYDYQDDVCKFVILETGSMYSKYAKYDCGTVFLPECKVRKI
jgi:lipopolysaccharide transport system ATP-binding protein